MHCIGVVSNQSGQPNYGPLIGGGIGGSVMGSLPSSYFCFAPATAASIPIVIFGSALLGLIGCIGGCYAGRTENDKGEMQAITK